MTPTRVRYQVLVLACCLSALTYLDRACFGVATPTIVAELGLSSEADLKGAITAFAIAYGLFEVPTGWLGDRYGPRRVLIRIVLWWSLFTGLTGLVANWTVAGYAISGVIVLTIVRFMFGAGEAGAFPNISRALHNWFPPQARARALGYIWMSARLTGGLTPLVWTVLVAGTSATSPLLTWREGFLLFGLLGLVWCVLFAWIFRNRPTEHPQTNSAECELISAGRESTGGAHRVPWAAILFNRNLLCLYVMYFCITYGWYFHMTYLPACLENRYGVEKTSVVGAIMKGGPLWLGAVGCLIGGYLVDGLLRRGVRLRWARRLPGLIGLSLCAVCYLLAAEMPSAWSFAIAISLAAFFNDLTIGGTWAMCQDVGGRHTAVVAGFLNTSASAGAAVAGWCSGMVLDYYIARRPATEHVAALVDGYQTNLLIYAVVTVVAAISWLGADAERPVDPQ